MDKLDLFSIYPRAFYKSWFTQAIATFNCNFNYENKIVDKWHFVTTRPNTVITPQTEWYSMKAAVVNLTVFVSVYQYNKKFKLYFVTKEIEIIRCKEYHASRSSNSEDDIPVEIFEKMTLKSEVVDSGDLDFNQDLVNYIGYAEKYNGMVKIIELFFRLEQP